MTLAFTNWQDGRRPGRPYTRCSPNLDVITAELGRRFGGYSLGCYSRRPIRGGVAWSSHSFGAAKDWRIDAASTRAAAVSWLIKHHDLLGVQAVHDYVGSRIWRSDRAGWRRQTPSASTGMGQAWAKYLHIETNAARWADATPVASRLMPAGAAHIVHAPPYVPFSLRRGVDDPARIRWLQTILNQRGWATPPLVVSGRFDARTDAAVKTMQRALRVVVDGIYGPQTANALHQWFASVAA
jgi:peptidoglycan hydrolase-like protein with peptidoglycan-binding domain